MGKKFTLIAVVILLLSQITMAQDTSYVSHVERGLLGTVIYSLLGIIMMMFAVKVVDWFTPGSLLKRLTEEKNIAVALFTSAIVIGICIIIAAAIAN